MRENRMYFYALIALCFGVLCVFVVFGVRHLEIEFLEATKGDEFPQILQFENMYEGALALNIKQFFAFGFYNYGFVYYVLNLFVTAPFFALDNYALAIYAPRILNAIFVLLNVVLLYRIARLYLNAKNAFLLVLIFVSMGGFWLGGFNIKPDFFQSFFILLCAYFLLLDSAKFGKNYYFAIVALGLGVGIAKFQAVMFLPLIYCYICLPCVLEFKKQNIFVAFKRLFVASVAIFALWIITNPYLLHPRGARAWWNMFEGNMSSNATNHGSYIMPSLSDKIFKVVDFYYFEIFVFVILVAICAYFLVRFLVKKDARFCAIVSIIAGFGISLLYLLFCVNKIWASYYISTISLGVVILGIGGGQIMKNHSTKFFSVILILQIFFGIANGAYGSVFSDKKDLDFIKQRSEMMIFALKKVAPQGKIYNVLTNNTAFAYLELGLKPKNIFNVYGRLDKQGFVYEEWAKKPHTFAFAPKDFIVLFKDSAFFGDNLHNDKNLALSIEVLKELDSAKLPYKKVFDDENLVIYQNIDFAHSLIAESPVDSANGGAK
ncbi:ArnT family glycosyltransferase [Helicobacter sp. 23-1044]